MLERLQRSPQVHYVLVVEPSVLSTSLSERLQLELAIEVRGARLITGGNRQTALVVELLESLYAVLCEADTRARSERAKAAWARKKNQAA